MGGTNYSCVLNGDSLNVDMPRAVQWTVLYTPQVLLDLIACMNLT